jgi:hypothetical protein
MGMAHADDEPVMVRYSSMRNVNFRSRTKDGEDLGYTWGEWRGMSRVEQDEALSGFANSIVDVLIVDDES